MTHLSKNPKYECPPMIPTRVWKALIDDGKESAMRKLGKLRTMSKKRTMTYFLYWRGLDKLLEIIGILTRMVL